MSTSILTSNRRKTTNRIFLSLIISLSLTMDFSVPDYSYIDMSQNSELLLNVRMSLMPDMFMTTIVFGVAFVLYAKFDELVKNEISFGKNKVYYFICMIIGIIWLAAESFMIDDTLASIHSTNGQILKSIIFYGGTVSLLVLIGKILYVIVNNDNLRYLAKYDTTKKENIHGGDFLLALCWLPHIIMAYPASIVPDAWAQLSMFWGRKTFTAHHPPFHTWLIGIFTVLGRKLGSGNIGVFLFILVQAAVFLMVLSYMFTVMKNLGTPKILVRLTYFIAITSPYYTESICVISKDTIYSYLFLLYMIELVCFFKSNEKYLKSGRHIILFVISASFVILFRKNGKYIVYPVLIIILGIMIKNRSSLNKQLVRKGITMLFLSIIIPAAASIILTNAYKIENGSIKEMLSLPFQQTARYVKCHADEITESEREAIDSILDYDSLAEKYRPDISDPVKATFNKEYTSRELLNYFKIWAEQFIKHPLTYVSATINQNYKLIYPAVLEYIRLETYKGDGGEFSEWLGIKENAELTKREGKLESFYQIMFRMPVLGAFSIVAFYNLILIYSLIYAFYKKYYLMFIVAVPLVLTDLVIIAGPVVDVRYAFPIIFSLPIVIAYCLNIIMQHRYNERSK